MDITESACVPWTTPSSSVITWIYYDPKSVNSYMQAYLPNATDVVCRCGDVRPVTGKIVVDPNVIYYCGFECPFSPGGWCIHPYMGPGKDRMRVYPLTSTTITICKCNTTDDIHRHIWIHAHI